MMRFAKYLSKPIFWALVIAGLCIVHPTYGQIPWDYQSSSKIHTIALPNGEVLTADGQALDPNDAVGLFYKTDSGKFCGGYHLWKNLQQENELKAYGKAESNAFGFSPGDSILIRVYDESEGCAIDAVNVSYRAGYDPPFFKHSRKSQINSWSAKRGSVVYKDTALCVNTARTEEPRLKAIDKPVFFKTADGNDLAIDNNTGVIYPDRSQTGIYTINFQTDQCLRKDRQTFRLNQQPQVNLALLSPLCQGGNSTLVAISDEAETAFNWESGQTGDSLTVTKAGRYQAVGMNGAGCKDTASYKVSARPNPGVTLPTDTIEQCKAAEVAIPRGPKDSIIRWSNGGRGYQIEIAKTQQLSVTRVDTFGCQSTDTLHALISPSLRLKQLNPVIKPVTCDGNPGFIRFENLKDQISGGLPPYQFNLKAADGAIIESPQTSSYPGLKEGYYSLSVSDRLGCNHDNGQRFRIRKQQCDEKVVVIGEAGKREPYYIPYKGTAKVYNRQGELQAQFEAPKRWFGRDSNGRTLPVGVYHVVIDQNKQLLITVLR